MAAPAKKYTKRTPKQGFKLHKSSKEDYKKKTGHTLQFQKGKAGAQLSEDVPDFPRGGGRLLSRQEKLEIHEEVDAEYKAEGLKNQKRRKLCYSKNNRAPEDELGLLFGSGISARLPRFANKLTMKNIVPGMKLLGVVSEVNEKDLVVSLPGGLRGLVRASEIFDDDFSEKFKESEGAILPSIFFIGQLVSCVVLQLDDENKEKGKRRIWLSLRLSLLHKGLSFDAVEEGMVLTGYVKSIEDRGYILHFGLPSFVGFLSKDSSVESNEHIMKMGKFIQGVVKSIDKTRKVVFLSSDHSAVSKSVTKGLKGISIDNLVPGMMVNARVQAILENGIMLSFLTYFTGTVDIFHLQNTLPTATWKVDYPQNKMVNARILFIDLSSRAVGLTLNPHLVHNKAPAVHAKTGDVYDHSKVIRVDRGSGLLLEIPSVPVSSPGYVGIHDIADGEVQKLEKQFKEGNHVRVRILGFRHLDGLAIGTLKASAVDGSLFTHSDVMPGVLVKAKVIVVDSFGAIIQFPSGMKALCPVQHMSELEIAKPRKKFKVGVELLFRVLGCKSKRITVTHKKTLVKSKLPVLTSYADATEGLITHGWITKIEKNGCFIRFYNGVQGFAPRFELGIEPGVDVSSQYHVGQVVKCRVTSSVPTTRRINLSFVIKPSRVSKDSAVKVGSLVSGVVEALTPHEVSVFINDKGFLKGVIPVEHLSDHHGLAASMKAVLKAGYKFDQLLVLDARGNNLTLSAKYSLINGVLELPRDHTQIQMNSVLHGYICNIIESGCFVRFLGNLTGFSPKRKALNDHEADLSEAFFVGQSVRSAVVDVKDETSRITLSLKQSHCSSIDASFIREYFLLDEKIAQIQWSNSEGSELNWIEAFNFGDLVEGKVHERNDFGVVVCFEKYDDVFGFISHNQFGGTSFGIGSVVRAAVLDVSKAERVVDLTLKVEFVDKDRSTSINSQNYQKKRKRDAHKALEVHQTVNAVVEIVKDNYVVLSLPDYNYAVGYAALHDYNTQKLSPKQYVNGQSVVATIMDLPSPSSSGRLLLLLKSICEGNQTSCSKKARKKSSYKVGSLVQAEITEIRPLELRVKFGLAFHGRVHITEANDDNLEEHPFNNFRVGQTLTACIIAKPNTENRNSYQWELSIKPKGLVGSIDGDNIETQEFKFSIGQYVSGYVYKVDSEWAWLAISRHVRAQLFILDSACEPSELKEFKKCFDVGKAVSGYVLCINGERKLLRLVPHLPSKSSNGTASGGAEEAESSFDNASNKDVSYHIHEGDTVGGRISKILPGAGGLVVQIGPHLYGKVHFTELSDSWLPEPLSGYHEQQFVKCKVLEISHSVKGTIHVDLSLRLSPDGTHSHNSSGQATNCIPKATMRVEKFEDLCPEMTVQGYVKHVSSKGCFILLSRNLEARIALSHLSDAYIENPAEEFPAGKLISGRVLSVEPISRRVEVTLRTSNASKRPKSEIHDLSCYHVGDIISGRIKRVEPYGLFITIDHTNMVGLCHVSEISDDRIDNIETKYKTGDRVNARILKVDEERHRISLGMKKSYIEDDLDVHTSHQRSGEAIHANVDGIRSTISPDRLLCEIENTEHEQDSKEQLVFAEAESRVSVMPLDVPLDDLDDPDPDSNDMHDRSEALIDDIDFMDENRNRTKKKAKEREREISAAEERQLENGEPATADEFERLVRSSPNSSFVWIKYMAFMLSLADVEKARSVAERALSSINFREEPEKLNIWVAYFNLENEYGNPPEEAVRKLFQRALQLCEPKKVHLALLQMYERTEQHKSAGELINTMTRKFKRSCKVWLRRVQWLLKQNQGGIPAVVSRALLSLPRHKHIKYISQTGILEFKCGVPDRGRTMFEEMLREYPKRTDLWSIYLDQEIRLGDVDVIRSLFERAISLSLPLKKMKFLFKKYLEFEKSQGDDELVESVKKKAIDYIQSVGA